MSDSFSSNLALIREDGDPLALSLLPLVSEREQLLNCVDNFKLGLHRYRNILSIQRVREVKMNELHESYTHMRRHWKNWAFKREFQRNKKIQTKKKSEKEKGRKDTFLEKKTVLFMRERA